MMEFITGKLRKPVNPRGNQVRCEEYNFCKCLNLKAIPYLGQYGNYYQWMIPQNIMRPVDCSFLDDVPPALRKACDNYSKEFPTGEIEFFTVNYNGTILRRQGISSGQNRTRINLVLHPYVFYNCGKGQTHKTIVHSSLYQLTPYDPIYKCHEGNNIALSFNEEDLYVKETMQEVILHPSEEDNQIMAISPNNMAFIISLTHPIISFYTASIIKYGNYSRLLISLLTIVNEPNLPLVRNIDEILNREKLLTHTPVREQIKNKEFDLRLNKMYVLLMPSKMDFLKDSVQRSFSFFLQEISVCENEDIDKIESIIQDLGIVLFTACEDLLIKNKVDKLVGQSFLHFFYEEIWRMFSQPRIPNFGREYFRDMGLLFKIELLRKFMRLIFHMLSAISRQHINMLQEFMADDSEGFVDFDAKKMAVKLSNPKKRVGAMLEEVGENERKEEDDLEPLAEKEEDEFLKEEEDIFQQHSPLSEKNERKEQDQEPQEENQKKINEEQKVSSQQENKKSETKPKNIKIKKNVLRKAKTVGDVPLILLNSRKMTNLQKNRFEGSDYFEKNPEKLTNPDIKLLEEHLTQIMSENSDDNCIASFLNLSSSLQNYIFYNVWKMKGAIDGIHDNFGRCSYFKTHEIAQHYHFTKEEAIELLLNVQEMLQFVDDL